MIVFMHFLSIREKDNTFCQNGPVLDEFTQIKFGHMSTPFLPLHRHYVMQYETELLRIGERFGISDHFTLLFWDWSPTANCLIFTHELLGVPEYSYEAANVRYLRMATGQWYVTCCTEYRLKNKT